jgi:photosystem II stability/assembly factor-like uncharacterized protein
MKTIKLLFLIISISSFLNNASNAQWSQISVPTSSDVRCFTSIGTNVFAGTYGGGVFMTTNNGTNWTAVNFGLTNLLVNALISVGTDLYAGTYTGGVFKSANNGANWTVMNNGLTSLLVQSFCLLGSNLFVSTATFGVYYTNNGGSLWNQVIGGLPMLNVTSLCAMGSNIFAGTVGGVYISTNNGTNWTNTNNILNSSSTWGMAVIGSNLFAATYDYANGGGVYYTQNNGVNWISINGSIPTHYTRPLCVSGSNLFVGSAAGVYLSTNNGTSWIAKNQGINNNDTVYTLFIANNFIFAGITGRSAWKRSLPESLDVRNISTEIPKEYSIKQNYPNPFNPSTNIEFSVPKSSVIKIVVYDISGRALETLVNESLSAGSYKINWNASGYASGIYFYKISADNFSQSHKMILVK